MMISSMPKSIANACEDTFSEDVEVEIVLIDKGGTHTGIGR